MKILAASAVMLCAAGVAGGPQDSRPLSIALLVDVTASLHLCPGGIAGAPSTAGQGLGSTLATSRAVGDIPPAVAEFRLDGIEPRDRIRVAAIGRHLIWMGTVVEGDSPDLKKNWHNVFALPPIEWLGPSPIWTPSARSRRGQPLSRRRRRWFSCRMARPPQTSTESRTSSPSPTNAASRSASLLKQCHKL